VRGAEGTANHTEEKKQKDEEARTDGFGTWGHTCKKKKVSCSDIIHLTGALLWVQMCDRRFLREVKITG
jgi:hypothetical protein